MMINDGDAVLHTGTNAARVLKLDVIWKHNHHKVHHTKYRCVLAIEAQYSDSLVPVATILPLLRYPNVPRLG